LSLFFGVKTPKKGTYGRQIKSQKKQREPTLAVGKTEKYKLTHATTYGTRKTQDAMG
jgi:hypothetical protein